MFSKIFSQFASSQSLLKSEMVFFSSSGFSSLYPIEEIFAWPKVTRTFFLYFLLRVLVLALIYGLVRRFKMICIWYEVRVKIHFLWWLLGAGDSRNGEWPLNRAEFSYVVIKESWNDIEIISKTPKLYSLKWLKGWILSCDSYYNNF